MAYDRGLAQRIREMLEGRDGIAERQMFGGIAFMSHGRMFVGVAGHALMARIGSARYDETLAEAHVRPMDFTGKPMKGYVFVDPPGLAADADLQRWIDGCAAFVAGLPPKDSPKRSGR
jgi:hypothetical protein